MPARYLVTSALPYANGPIHFGHVAGAYLPADVWVRYKRLTGAEVLYICGTDEHGAPIIVNAEEEGVEPREYADRWHRAIKESFDRLSIEFDNFSRTSRPVHAETTTDFFRQLDANGYVEAKTEDQLFCDHCGRGLPDRFVTGTCPKPDCGYEKARGDECPKCGWAFDSTDLIDPRCNTCGHPASRRPARHWYLDLPKLKPKLDAYHAERFERWRPNVVGEVKKYMADLRSRAITRDLSWGIPVPLEEAAGKVFYVWFDAPIGYVSSTKEWARERGLPDDEWRRWWQGDDTRLIHFIGKDNIAFHCVIFPGMLLGQDDPYALPDVPANEFLNLEGQKFSTSGGWFVSIDEFCQRYSPDTLRWTLARNAPESKDSDFSYKDFQTRVNTELLNVFGNFTNRVLKFVKSRYGGEVPAAEAPLGPEEEAALAALREGAGKVAAALEEFSLRKASQEVLEVGYAANKLIEDAPPFKTIKDDPPRAATTIHTAVRLVEGLAVLLYPFVPGTAKKIWKQLGLAGEPKGASWEGAAAPPDPAGRKIGKVKHLFQKVEDEVVAKEVAALEARAAEAAKAAGGGAKAEIEAVPIKPEVEFDDFMKLDVRIARVAAAEPVPKADKLLKLDLELAGGERRTVVSGIKAWYAPERLVGRQVVYLANLKPRKLRGVVSQGMVLAANDVDQAAILLQPDREAPDGAAVT